MTEQNPDGGHAQVAILGAGVMGETLLSGLLRAGRPAASLLVGEKRRERATELQRAVRRRGGAEPRRGPQGGHRGRGRQAAGHGRAPRRDRPGAARRPAGRVAGRRHHDRRSSSRTCPDGVAVVRVMPNTPALVDEGMAAISRGSHCDERHLAEAESLLASTGRVMRVPEKQQDAVTAISGSGPAYLFFVVEAMIEAGVHLGLPRTTATELVVQTVVGSAKLLRETGEHPTVLREQVTSPGGTTAAAIRQLEDHKVRAAFLTRDGGRPRPLARARRGQLSSPLSTRISLRGQEPQRRPGQRNSAALTGSSRSIDGADRRTTGTHGYDGLTSTTRSCRHSPSTTPATREASTSSPSASCPAPTARPRSSRAAASTTPSRSRRATRRTDLDDLTIVKDAAGDYTTTYSWTVDKTGGARTRRPSYSGSSRLDTASYSRRRRQERSASRPTTT